MFSNGFFFSCSMGMSHAVRWRTFLPTAEGTDSWGHKISHVPIEMKTADNVNNAGKKKKPTKKHFCFFFFLERNTFIWFSYIQSSWKWSNSIRIMVLSYLLLRLNWVSQLYLRNVNLCLWGVEDVVYIGIDLHAWANVSPHIYWLFNNIFKRFFNHEHQIYSFIKLYKGFK